MIKLKLHSVTADHPSYLSGLQPLTATLLSFLVASSQELKQIQHPEILTSSDACYTLGQQFLGDIQQQHDKVLICGDYDCDGITSTTLMCLILDKLQISYGYYIPNRLTQGYGTSVETVQMAYDKGYSAIIMVDNGVKQHEALALCRNLNMKVMVIDHHQIQEPVDCDVLIHNDYLSEYFKNQCGAGLVYGLALKLDLVDEYMAVLAGIGTIGDMMPIRNQNRALVIKTLQLLNQKEFPTLSPLLKNRNKITLTSISFQIVPIFNAVGRMADLANVNNVVKYLLSDDVTLINHFIPQLIQVNQTRKNLSNSQSELANSLISKDWIQIIASTEFHEGLIGIIAGRISNQEKKVTIVLSQKEAIYKASVRSQNQINVYELLKPYQDKYFLSFGGHDFACAFSIEAQKYPQFKQELINHQFALEVAKPQIEAISVQAQDLRLEVVDELAQFEPFGQDFDLLPIYVEALVISVLPLKQSGYSLKVFGCGDLQELLVFMPQLKFESNNFRIKVVGTLQKNYRGQLSLIVKEIID